MSINQFLQQIGQGDTVRDFQHASRLFVGDNFNLAPRQGFLYHVFIDLNPTFAAQLGRQKEIEAGMLVKSVDLPKFSIDTKTLNSYNRPNLVQTKVKYDPINIAFHDDHADVVRSLWFLYYNYFYRDADLGYQGPSGDINASYRLQTKYGKRDNNNWGYSPKNIDTQFIHAIRIYSMSQKRFAEYVLINPMITAFKHGQHQAGSNEPMQHDMTIAYESVLYGSGAVSKNTVKGFAEIHYDTSPSPLTPAGGGTQSIIGPGGLLDSAGNIVSDLSKGDGLATAKSAFTAFRAYKNFKNVDIKGAAVSELKQFGTDILRGNNPLNKLFVPVGGNLSGGAPIYEYGKSTGVPSAQIPAGSATSNGESIGASLTNSVTGAYNAATAKLSNLLPKAATNQKTVDSRE